MSTFDKFRIFEKTVSGVLYRDMIDLIGKKLFDGMEKTLELETLIHEYYYDISSDLENPSTNLDIIKVMNDIINSEQTEENKINRLLAIIDVMHTFIFDIYIPTGVYTPWLHIMKIAHDNEYQEVITALKKTDRVEEEHKFLLEYSEDDPSYKPIFDKYDRIFQDLGFSLEV